MYGRPPRLKFSQKATKKQLIKVKETPKIAKATLESPPEGEEIFSITSITSIVDKWKI